MKFFTLPQMPNKIISHPTDEGWIFENSIVDEKNPIITTEEDYNDFGDPYTTERTSYPITYTINHLKNNGTIQTLFTNRKFPFQLSNITKIEENFFLKSETTTSSTNLPFPKAFDYSLDFRYYVSFYINSKHILKNNINSTYFGFMRESDRLFLEEKFTNIQGDSGIILFDRNTGISQILEPFPTWKLFRQPTLAISQDGLTIIGCYTNVKDGTCTGAIFDNPLID